MGRIKDCGYALVGVALRLTQILLFLLNISDSLFIGFVHIALRLLKKELAQKSLHITT